MCIAQVLRISAVECFLLDDVIGEWCFGDEYTVTLTYRSIPTASVRQAVSGAVCLLVLWF